jgi:Transposase DDE domain
MVACSAKLLDFGMQTGRKSRDETHKYKHLKFTIGYNGHIPEKVKFYDQDADLSEDIPLSSVIKSMAFSSKDVAVFDRGLKSRKIFDEFSQKGEQERLFVCRINPTTKFKVIETKPIINNQNDTLSILSDQIVKLYDEKNRLTKAKFRLIIAQKNDESGDKIFFCSNILDDLSPIDITEIYRLRWEIERFFRFIKQNLNRAANRFSHLISRDYNAIKSMTYIMLIAAMFIALFNKLNNRTGFKLSKLALIYELEIEIVKELVILCNGDPNLLNQYLAGFGQ